MNAHFFGTKRAFHATLRIMRKPLASFGLTAARYDMLYAIFGGLPRRDRIRRFTTQRELCGKLGVHKSVVSRMLRSLEQIGLVERRRASGDERQRCIWLTSAGMDRLRAAARCLERASMRLVCIAICFWGERFRHLYAYESYLMAIRSQYGDRAWLPYRWGHPDD
jgi:DNA-binding MarR family transcriptional regulator